MVLGRSFLRQWAGCLGMLALAGCAPIPATVPPAVDSPAPIPAADPLIATPPAPAGQPGSYRRPVVPPQVMVPRSGLPPASGAGYLSYPAMQQFLRRMEQTHGFNRDWLQAVFSQVRRNADVLTKASTPAESKSWQQYRPIFMTESRINSGLGFWQQHAVALEAAARQYGVDPAYIVAIIGVETQYGSNVGKHPVLQALTTLAMDFPQRSDFYTRELEQYLLLAREERFDPLRPVGSYAGAMGLGQFISSSYRQYAVDFNHDQHRDLWSADDAIGSVANYLARHQWRRGQDVAAPAYASGQGYARLASEKPVNPSKSLGQLAMAGVQPSVPLRMQKAGLIVLDGREYWVTGENFYVITRYNHSNKYAMAVHQLAEAIRQRMGR